MPLRPRSRRNALDIVHLLALVLVSLGLLVKPVLVGACEVDDLFAMQALQAPPASHAGDPGVDGTLPVGDAYVDRRASAGDPGEAAAVGDSCCPGKTCSACCTPSTVLPLASVAMPLPPLKAGLVHGLATPPGPSTQPVAIRPPITA